MIALDYYISAILFWSTLTADVEYNIISQHPEILGSIERLGREELQEQIDYHLRVARA